MPDQCLVSLSLPASCCLFTDSPIATACNVSHTCETVQGGERAVMFNRIVGVKQFVYEEGTHFKLPWFDIPTIFDIRTRPTTIKSLTGSKGTHIPTLPPPTSLVHPNPPHTNNPALLLVPTDLQMVELTIRVLTRPDKDSLPWIFQNIGEGALPHIHTHTRQPQHGCVANTHGSRPSPPPFLLLCRL